MSNSWSELLKQNCKQTELTNNCVVVVASPTVETLREFEKCFLPQLCSFDKKTMHLLGFTSSSFRDNHGRELAVDFYSTLFPLAEDKTHFLEAFVDMKSPNIKWWFLLDWALSDQKLWLRQLTNSVKTLQKAGANLAAGSITVACLNTNQIYFKLRNTTEWHSNHIEFLQQSLRSTCLLEKCSLIYADSSDSCESGQQVFVKLLFDNYREIEAEFVNTCKILIPYGSDTPGLIKTLDETFEPSEVCDSSFISQNYEKMIPEDKLANLQMPEEAPEEVLEEFPFDFDHPYSVDVQHELARLYQAGKKIFTNAKT